MKKQLLFLFVILLMTLKSYSQCFPGAAGNPNNIRIRACSTEVSTYGTFGTTVTVGTDLTVGGNVNLSGGHITGSVWAGSAINPTLGGTGYSSFVAGLTANNVMKFIDTINLSNRIDAKMDSATAQDSFLVLRQLINSKPDTSSYNDSINNLKILISNKLDVDGNGSLLVGLTKNQVDLSNVDNTSDSNKPISIATQAALDDKQSTLPIGVPGTMIRVNSGGSAYESFNPSYITSETDPTVPSYSKSLNEFSVIKTSTDTLYYPLTGNPSGFLSSITSSQINIALGYTPYNGSTNPNGYISFVPAQSFSSLTGKPTTLSGYGIVDAYPLTGNPSGFLTSITLGQITTALGYTPISPSDTNVFLRKITASSLYQSKLGYTPISPSDTSVFLRKTTAISLYQPKGSYLTSESDPIYKADSNLYARKTYLASVLTNYYTKTQSDGRYLLLTDTNLFVRKTFLTNTLSSYQTISNLQNNLTSSSTKYPSVDAVNNGLSTKIGLTSLSASTPLSYNNSTGVFTISQSTGSTNGYLSSTDWTTFNNKQATLTSGTNIKTIETQTILGSGNIDLNKSDVGLGNVDNTSDAAKPVSTATQSALNAKQDLLQSGVNIKTVGGQTLLGTGDISLNSGTVTSVGITSSTLSFSGSPITTSGNITINLPNTGITAGTYNTVTVDAQGRVTAGNSSSPTTVTRSLNTNYKISSTQSTRVSYSFTHTIALTLLLTSGSTMAYLEISPDNGSGSPTGTWTTISQAGYSDGVAVAVSLNKTTTNNVQGEVPGNTWFRIRTVGTGAGLTGTTPNVAYNCGQETTY